MQRSRLFPGPSSRPRPSLCAAASLLAALALLTSCDSKGRDRFSLNDNQVERSTPMPKGTPAKEESPEEEILKLLTEPKETGNRRRIAVSALDGREPMADTRMHVLDRFANMREGIRMAYWDAQGNPAEQAAQIRRELAEKPFALILIGGDEAALNGALADAIAQKVKVVSLGCALDAAHCTTSILVDERKLGRIAGEFVVDALKRKSEAEGRAETVGRVVQITGNPDSRGTRERSAGFTEALAKSPGVLLVHDAPAHWDAKETNLRLQEALRLQQRFDVVFAHSDIMARAASDTLKALKPSPRENTLILGVDGSVAKGGGVDMILKGDLDASVYNPPMVDLAWKILVRLLDEPSFQPKPRYDLDPFVITPAKATDISLHGVPPPSL